MQKDEGIRNVIARDVFNATASSDKERFQLWIPGQRGGQTPAMPSHIRACQGHSMAEVKEDAIFWENQLTLERPRYYQVWHGTRMSSLRSILRLGLVPGGLDKDRHDSGHQDRESTV